MLIFWRGTNQNRESTKINCNRFLINTLVDISVLHIKIRSLVEYFPIFNFPLCVCNSLILPKPNEICSDLTRKLANLIRNWI